MSQTIAPDAPLEPRNKLPELPEGGYSDMPIPFWVRVSGLAAFIVLYGSLFPLVKLLDALQKSIHLSDVSSGVLLAGFGEVFAIAYLVWLGRRFHVKATDTLSFHRVNVKQFCIGAAAGVALFIGLQVVMGTLLSLGVHTSSSNTSNSMQALTGWQRPVFLVIFPAIVAPILEESLFRGGLFSTFAAWKPVRSGKNFWLPLVSTALLFSLMHYQGFSTVTDVFVLVWIFVVGMTNGFLKCRYNSIVVSIASHVFYNGLTALAIVLATQH